ncbi:MAG: PDZ domain-containing protein [Acidobacteria bacterium]|nr:PDZ domain-containing protein [Acidobacteriota bacterium]
MTVLKTAVFAAGLVAAAGAVAALAPPVSGQSATTRSAVWPHDAHMIDVFAMHGSQIGVTVRDMEEDDLKRAKLTASAGVVVDDVSEGSPAEKAGIKDGDIIAEFDGERVRGVRQFRRLVQETPARRTVQAVVLRDGQRVTISVETRESDGARVLGKLDGLRDLEVLVPKIMRDRDAPPPPPTPPMRGFEGLLGRSSALGITVDDISSQLRGYFGVTDGVLVTSVNDDSSAARAGLKAGDVITSLDGASVNSPAELRRRTQRLSAGDEFTLGVVRDKKPLTLKGKADQPRARRYTTRTII